MKRQILRAIATLGFIMGLSVFSAYAQAQTSARANIPFEFYAGSAKLPAGTYDIRRASLGSPVFIIAKDDSRSAAMVMTHGSTRSSTGEPEAKLVFNRYGDQYFLSQVWTSSSADGNKLIMSKRERALRRELAKGDTQPQQVAVEARRRH